MLLSGCASAGTKIEAGNVATIKKGVTTRAEMLARFGEPMADSHTSTGSETMVWSYAHVKFKGATFVPVVGLFAGGTRSESSTLLVTLRDGIVQEFSTSQGVAESHMGH